MTDEAPDTGDPDSDSVPKEARARRRLVARPDWLRRFESSIGTGVPLAPNTLSGIKLFLVTPLIVLALRQVDVLPRAPALLIALLAVYGLLDYLEELVAKARGMDTGFGRVFDRFTDYPLIVTLAVAAASMLPISLVVGKLTLDLMLLVLYAMGRGSTQNRLRNGISFTTLFGLLALSQGWAERLVTPEVVTMLLVTNVVFSATVVLYNVGILQKRFIADALSLSNLTCGCFSMYFAVQLRVDVSLLFLMLGAAFDAVDGAAARRWGGTSMGVYSDDVADGVNFGVAPGVALAFVFPGIEGVILGVFYTTFTLSRLVFFTLNKDNSDPNYFAGVPSPVGALTVMSTLVLLGGDFPSLVGLLVGIGCVQMVSFDTHYKHLGRAAFRYRRTLIGIPFFLFAFFGGWVLGYKEIPVAMLLGACLIYGFTPVALHFINIVRLNKTAA